MAAQPRLLIVGLDGASFGLMQSLIDAGCLPTFARFAREARSAPLRCTWPPHTATGWTTLFSGRLPGRHGIFQFWDCQAPDYQLHVTPGQAAGCPLIWDALAAQGWRLGLINIPMSHPPGRWPGYEITWPLTATLHYCRPPGLLRELSAAGAHLLPDIACMYDGAPDYPRRALGFIQARTRAVRHLLRHHPVDAVAVVYTEIDRVCHHYWHGLDRAHPEHRLAAPADAHAIAATYAAMDAAFAELLELVDDTCTVMVVSDHGFGPGTRALRIHQLLAEADFCTLHPASAGASQPAATGETDANAGYLAAIDWERTLAYMPTPGSFGLNLNLRGRQARGLVAPGERRAVEAELIAYLRSLRDPESGAALFAAVVPGAQAYAGPYADRAPDLLLVPNDPALMIQPDLGGPAWDRPAQIGLHRLEGLWMLRSPGPHTPPGGAMVAAEEVAGLLLQALGIADAAFDASGDSGAAQAALAAAGLPAAAWSVAGDPPPLWSLPTSGDDTSLALVAAGMAARHDPPPFTEHLVFERLRAMGYV